MGLFRQMKQLKQVTAEAPDLVRSAMALQQAQATAANAAMASAVAASTAKRDDVVLNGGGHDTGDSIAGVSLVEYAAVTRTATDQGISDPVGFAGIARQRGIDAASWDAAMLGWAERFAVDPAAAMRFSALWRGAN
jgi:hypothetical protein